ncbi:indolepyruvate ferredoxin oxidoreductase alpha subunit [Ruminococcaceae bacterium KH2T8]|nr:indolepyruvate ferredoxin oxidoreductase alpha subunit [Ruminococcaceae bacterium KH2T8]
MHKEFMMGNEAIAMGAVAAGVNLVAGYPGTPSTEVLETVAKYNDGSIYVEWSVNEKAAMEVAAGAAYSGARTMVTMKQVGLNVASDPLMSLEYVGVKGGMVIMVADDPGPISSQTEQDTRTFAMFSKVPCFDPTSAQEAYEMIGEAFEYSEKYHTPVFFRPTTRICHAYASVEVKDENEFSYNQPEGFIKDSSRWVIFPKLSNRNHALIEKRNRELSDVFSDYKRNEIIKGEGRLGIAANGISFANAYETIKGIDAKPSILKVVTPFPFPEKLAVEFLKEHDEVLCIEELDPVIERELTYICGKYHLDTKIRGKLTDDVALSGENSRDDVRNYIYGFMGLPKVEIKADDNCPELPVRPPVLCAGCPHRASFYAVKKAMKGKETIFAGDIGCYTLGNAMPLDMVDTCLCMGAGVNIAQGVGRIKPDTKCFSFVGDSTFFASAITGAVNAVYNQSETTLVILDNSTTAMTGHQPHPGTGKTMMGEITSKIDIESVLRGVGVTEVRRIDPLQIYGAIETVKEVADMPGVKAIIFESPCAMLFKPEKACSIDSGKCIDCRKCIKEIGCPGLIVREGKVAVDDSLCNGCGLCSQICPVEAITKGGN